MCSPNAKASNQTVNVCSQRSSSLHHWITPGWKLLIGKSSYLPSQTPNPQTDIANGVQKSSFPQRPSISLCYPAPAALPHSVPPNSKSYAFYPKTFQKVRSSHQEELEKFNDIADIYGIPPPSHHSAHGDGGAPHALTAELLNPASQERRRCHTERQSEKSQPPPPQWPSDGLRR